MASRDGYFAPESAIRRVGNTPVVPLLAGGAAVLLQVAHPLVAGGVVEHSDYQNDLWRRLARTLEALYFVVYGTRQEARRAAASVQAVHARVHGVTREALGRFPVGTRYSATNPELMLWVHATLVQASIVAYERFVEKLSADEEERYYQEMALVARIFGTPGSVIPASLGDFQEYFQSELESGDICVTRPAREVASVILDAPLPAPLRVLAPAHRLSTAGLLPAKLREEYGLRWNGLHERMLPLAAHSLQLSAAPLLRIASRLAPPARGLAA
ncbi:MAG: DUF2236 domain-containing protein [Actinomycetota bacterium]|nr:DUF2236 domain-containing protein [Actinomycetota bacterium]